MFISLSRSWERFVQKKLLKMNRQAVQQANPAIVYEIADDLNCGKLKKLFGYYCEGKSVQYPVCYQHRLQ
ncbi:hypothetical protein [Acetonema longum]|uniref:Uncharacterized protein n=1 Tax=Acetonema longum DSM 6540 TaxID=1009370 RepID=F7NPT6_9FIRM|nr:hypothetical protein [Acetonema longum]EGO61927.1 hypothetical protein ALO_20667 [Acetonema longum DSM 6540]